MPLYTFENPENGQTKDIYQKMLDKHEYEESGVKWRRVFVKPQAATNTVILDPFNPREFISATSNKKETYGDILDRSKELSEKRKAKDGVDLVKKKYAEDWSKARNGKKIPQHLLD